MKKLFIILFSVLLFPVHFTNAQTPAPAASTPVNMERKGYIGISGGVAFPYSDFASKNLNNNLAGAANSGATFNVSFGYRLGRKFGIAGLILAQQNPMDKNTIDALLNDEAQSAQLGVRNTTVTNWKTAGLLAGGYFVSGSKIAFTMRLLVGYLASKAPALSYTMFNSTSSINAVQQEGDGGTLAALFGVGIKADLSETICFLGNLDFLNTKPEFSNVGLYGNGTLLGTQTYSQEINTLNFTVGIGFKLK